MADLKKLVKNVASMGKDEAKKVLEFVKTPEQAIKLAGDEREAYLKALDINFGDQAKRSADMGFGPETYYHGSFRDIKQFKPEKGHPEGFLGKSIYMTNDPVDASMNYAEKESPDYRHKLESLIESFRNDSNLNYTAAKEAAEKKLFGRVDSGAVYPLRVRTKKTADLTPYSNQYIDLNPIYDDSGELISENPTAKRISDGIFNRTAEATGDGNFAAEVSKGLELYEDKKPSELLKNVKKIANDAGVSDDEGRYIGSELGRGALEDAGYDSAKIYAKEQFERMPNITEETEHLMAFDPAKIRSKYAAFDPRFKDSPYIMALNGGAAAPGVASKIASKIGSKTANYVANQMDPLNSLKGVTQSEPIQAAVEGAKQAYDTYDKYYQQPMADIADKISKGVVDTVTMKGQKYMDAPSMNEMRGAAAGALSMGLQIATPDPLMGAGDALKVAKSMRIAPKVIKEAAALSKADEMAAAAKRVKEAADSWGKVQKGPVLEVGSSLKNRGSAINPLMITDKSKAEKARDIINKLHQNGGIARTPESEALVAAARARLAGKK